MASGRDTEVSELLLRWRELRQQGQTVSVEELCLGAPELAAELQKRIQAIEAMERQLALGPESASPTSAATSSEPGSSRKDPPRPVERLQLPGYELLEILDQGGMGTVYKARQVRLKRLVALKMIRADPQAQPQHRARFRIEAEAVAQLQHPHIVQIYDIVDSEERPYYSMEFVDGGSLAGKIAGRPLEPREAARLLAILAETMAFAHQRGVIHRDLKPANILLTADGVPKIADFGLAKRLDHDAGLSGPGAPTQSGVILGTPSYMAPEQAQGQSKAIGPAADVYALGAILYEMLTGRPPFSGATPLDTVLQVMSQEPVPPSQQQPAIPRDLETICLKCLEKSAIRRYPSAAALAEDLRRYLDGQPITARSISIPRRLARWARRRPHLAGLAGLLLLAALTLVFVFLWLPYQRERAMRATAVRLAPRVRVILHEYCYACHGQDPKQVEGELRVLDHAHLLDPANGLVVPGHAEESKLIRRIEDNSMPPEEDEEFPRLGSAEIATLKQWVAGGAPPFAAYGPDLEPGPEQRPTPLSAEVKEIFRDKCHHCHSLGKAKQGIKVLNHDLLLVKRKVVVAGAPDQSLLYQLLHSKDPKRVMPPADEMQLTPEEIDAIRRWIAEGARPFPRERAATR